MDTDLDDVLAEGSSLYAIVLAAGAGSRMRSERPKPLHRLCGKPMLLYVLDSLHGLDVQRTVIVVGHKGDWVTKKMQEHTEDLTIDFVEQRVQRGTGDATLVGLVGLPDDGGEDDGHVVVMPGDAPLLRPETMRRLVEHHLATDAAATVLTARMEDPTGYGRVVRRPDGQVTGIVEHGDATDEQRAIDEINTSIYCFRRSLLAPALRRVEPDNSQGEYYLTDVIGVLRDAGHRVEAVAADDAAEAQGINDRSQLAAAESELRRRTNAQLLASGVTMVDPEAVYVDTTVRIGRDVTLFPGVMLQGDTVVGDGTEVGPGTRLVDTVVGSDCVLDQTTARSTVIGDGCTVGPYASLLPGSSLPDGSSTGAFFTSDSGFTSNSGD